MFFPVCRIHAKGDVRFSTQVISNRFGPKRLFLKSPVAEPGTGKEVVTKLLKSRFYTCHHERCEQFIYVFSEKYRDALLRSA
jgi:hypothetical protein